MAEPKKLPTPQPKAAESIHEEPAEPTSTGPVEKSPPANAASGSSVKDDAPHYDRAQKAKEIGVEEAHLIHLEGVARAIGGRNWAKLYEVLVAVIKGLKDSGLLSGTGTPPTA